MRRAPLILISLLGWCSLSEPASAADTIDFARDIRPLLQEQCYKCHSAEKSKGGLRLDLKKSALLGGDSGAPAIAPGSPEKSRMIELIRGTTDGEFMPPKGPRLTARQADLLTRWIRAGAEWPASLDGSDATEPSHWSFRKPKRPAAPAVKTTGWAKNTIDFFVLAGMESHGLAPAAEADRSTLARRVALDLTGLPPTLAELDAFQQDKSPDAYERMVDHFLSSPGYGERWARMWLDLARYADSKGYGSDPLRPYMWRYRDWVIDAFNRNLPYDRFTTEQLAGDLLPNATTDQLLATCFHRNTMANDEGGTDDEEFRVAAIKDRIDTTMQVWMGITFGCAKCHSHKYDPITQRDYYSFYAFFNQTEDADRPDDSPRHPTPTPEQANRIEELKRDLEPLRDRRDHPKMEYDLARGAWEQRALNVAREWSALPPSSAQAAKSELYVQPDRSIVAVGATPPTNIFRVTFTDLASPVTGLRIELLPVESSGATRLGRNPRGPVNLSDIRAEITSDAPRFPRARYVRVELPGKGKYLSLAEVEVMSSGQNVALRGKASQSSTDFGGVAGRAIDGNTDGAHDKLSVTHTALNDDPWWEVDLGEAAPIETVTLWNRTDGGVEDRLKGFRVVLLDDQRSPVWTEASAPVPKPSTRIATSGAQPMPILAATTSARSNGAKIENAIDSDPKTSFSIAQGSSRPQEIVLAFAKPATFAKGEALTLTLTQTQGDGAAPAMFRVSSTQEKQPFPALPHAVAAALRTARDQRDAEQNREIAAFYWALSPEYQALVQRIRPLEDQLSAVEKQVVQTPVLRELAQKDQRVTRILMKGNFLTPGDSVSPSTPSAFHPLPAKAPTNRLGVAMWLTDPANPLTARVAVNRFWSALFSKGLLESEEDFGTQGAMPSHPELLDWLATEYPRLGWDTKALLKLLVTSASYRQSSQATSEQLQQDPRNVWLSRAPRPRLEAEMVRDQALALSGLLSRKMFGPSVYPPQPDNLWQAAFNGERNWATSGGEDKHRRGLYTFWRRTVPYPSMMAFDAPTREYCTIRRVPSNTPLQAFVTLNDPVFVEAAQALARRIMKEGGDTTESRVRWALRHATARAPEERQVEVLKRLFEESRSRYRDDAKGAKAMASSQAGSLEAGMDPAEAAAWSVVGNVLLNLDSVLTKG
ncbi:MAG: DUF1549 domain-containing protein [Verrucomicrobia bacterium]|nr:DUF1549 domain-containing protein [Verrucomicrobiota bacterium]